MSPPEKNARKLARDVRRATLSGEFKGKTCRIAAIFNDSCSNAALSDSVGRMQCDHKPTMRRKRLDLSMLPTSPFLDNFRLADDTLGIEWVHPRPIPAMSSGLVSYCTVDSVCCWI